MLLIFSPGSNGISRPQGINDQDRQSTTRPANLLDSGWQNRSLKLIYGTGHGKWVNYRISSMQSINDEWALKLIKVWSSVKFLPAHATNHRSVMTTKSYEFTAKWGTWWSQCSGVKSCFIAAKSYNTVTHHISLMIRPAKENKALFFRAIHQSCERWLFRPHF